MTASKLGQLIADDFRSRDDIRVHTLGVHPRPSKSSLTDLFEGSRPAPQARSVDERRRRGGARPCGGVEWAHDRTGGAAVTIDEPSRPSHRPAEVRAASARCWQRQLEPDRRRAERGPQCGEFDRGRLVPLGRPNSHALCGPAGVE